MTLHIEVDPTSPVPPYEQVRAQIAELAAAGDLATGARLPSIRQLSGDLGLAPGTVARAYRELEADGIVISRVRHGTVIAPRSKPTAKQALNTLTGAARAYAMTIRSLGVSRDEAIAALEHQLSSQAPEPG